VKKKRTKGRPPSNLTGQLPVSGDSPWWRSVASEVCKHLGPIYPQWIPIELLATCIQSYPDGRRPRVRTVARRLLEYGAIELVERGPNGSLSKGAKYKILPERSLPPAMDSEMIDNAEFLEKAVERMTREKGKR
jgi:hypothetical protein